jgi:hypothetical protein
VQERRQLRRLHGCTAAKAFDGGPAAHGPSAFGHPICITLTNAIGGDRPGVPDASSVLRQLTLIDYVHVSR